ncbi:MAG: UDP-glucose dehydrogenase family protein, partial [Actinomycetota bacterium]
MKIAVIGTGHVGLVTAATLAKVGHEVVGVDDDAAKITLLRQGKAPFFEPGLQDLIDETTSAGRLSFIHGVAEAVPGAQVAFICVGTPGRADGEANLSAVEKAATDVARHASGEMVVVGKSTVPVQTAERIKAILERNSSQQLHVVSNPEFLREGSAVRDSLEPDRILVGADSEHAHAVMREVFKPLFSDRLAYFATDVTTAELAKHACNAFLALKVSYSNALARICEAAGADVSMVADIMGADARIGRAFLNAGLGYGGYCLPKDVAAFRAQAARLGYEFALLDEVQRINDQALESTFVKIKESLWNLEEKRVALFGLAFKPGTDDVRESPALKLAAKLLQAGARVVGHDPLANEAATQEVPGLEVSDDPYAAAEGAHCVVIATEWPHFLKLDLARLKGILTNPLIIDGRN